MSWRSQLQHTASRRLTWDKALKAGASRFEGSLGDLEPLALAGVEEDVGNNAFLYAVLIKAVDLRKHHAY